MMQMIIIIKIIGEPIISTIMKILDVKRYNWHKKYFHKLIIN